MPNEALAMLCVSSESMIRPGTMKLLQPMPRLRNARAMAAPKTTK